MTVEELGWYTGIAASGITLLLKGPQLYTKVKCYWKKQREKRQTLKRISTQIECIIVRAIVNFPRYWEDTASKSSASEVYELTKDFYTRNLRELFLYCQEHKIVCPGEFPKRKGGDLNKHYSLIFRWERYIHHMASLLQKGQLTQIRQHAKKITPLLLRPYPIEEEETAREHRFKNGDTVCHKGSAKPIMTVEGYETDPSDNSVVVDCKWYDEEAREFKTAYFDENSIEGTFSVEERREQTQQQIQRFHENQRKRGKDNKL